MFDIDITPFKTNQDKFKGCCQIITTMHIYCWQVKEDMTTLVRQCGVNSFKMFMAYRDRLMLEDSEIYEVYEHCRNIGALAQMHAENGDVIDYVSLTLSYTWYMNIYQQWMRSDWFNFQETKRMHELGIFGPEGHELCRGPDVESEAVSRCIMIANIVNPIPGLLIRSHSTFPTSGQLSCLHRPCNDYSIRGCDSKSKERR